MSSAIVSERPIIFSAPMVRAILAGAKDQTRRLVKPQPDEDGLVFDPSLDAWVDTSARRYRPPYSPGDRLWVKEAYRFCQRLDRSSASEVAAKCLEAGYRKPWAPTKYEADAQHVNWERGFEAGNALPVQGRLRPSIHMPRWASRITREVASVRVERLQQISEADAMAEGVGEWAMETNAVLTQETVRDCFRLLWESLHAKNGPGWDASPWVWVIEFRMHPDSIGIHKKVNA